MIGWVGARPGSSRWSSDRTDGQTRRPGSGCWGCERIGSRSSPGPAEELRTDGQARAGRVQLMKLRPESAEIRSGRARAYSLPALISATAAYSISAACPAAVSV
ncbi:hypothetical protein [Paenibacillus sp. FSL M7-0896]|uniref:hypothetical protein n=1 Tax=Paenibacillus sp. FSL M7-0896 TaxID=2921610 RepID=UPI0030DAB177